MQVQNAFLEGCTCMYRKVLGRIRMVKYGFIAGGNECEMWMIVLGLIDR